ncbi:hypothetical protein, partial [Burkholderia multivorans]
MAKHRKDDPGILEPNGRLRHGAAGARPGRGERIGVKKSADRRPKSTAGRHDRGSSARRESPCESRRGAAAGRLAGMRRAATACRAPGRRNALT